MSSLAHLASRIGDAGLSGLVLRALDPNFLERRLGEVHRICLSRTRVNKAPNLLL